MRNRNLIDFNKFRMKSLGDKDRGRENRQQKKLTLTLWVDKRNNKKVIAYESEHDVVKQRKPIGIFI